MYENERNSVLQLFTKISSLQPVTAIWCGDPTWIALNFGFLKMCNFDIYVVHLGFGAKIWGNPCWVTTPYCCHCLHLTNSGDQL